MEIDVTNMVNDADKMIFLSGSIAELGENAGKLTWRNSLEYAVRNPLLGNDEDRREARDYFREFGAWDDEEIDGWDEAELQGITVQEVASSIREMINIEGDYEDYRAASENGQVSGNLYKGDDRRWYFYLGH